MSKHDYNVRSRLVTVHGWSLQFQTISLVVSTGIPEEPEHPTGDTPLDISRCHLMEENPQRHMLHGLASCPNLYGNSHKAKRRRRVENRFTALQSPTDVKLALYSATGCAFSTKGFSDAYARVSCNHLSSGLFCKISSGGS